MSNPKKIKNSKFNVTGEDTLTEYAYGVGAIRLHDCRIVMRDGGTVDVPGVGPISKMGMFGVAIDVPNMVNGDEAFQMWDCDVIIIPRKKYRKGFKGMRADQVLTSGALGVPESWEELIFDREDNVSDNKNSKGNK